MGKSSINYINTSYKKNSSYSTTSPVVYGNFPRYIYKTSPMEKINKFLSVILILLVMLSLLSYYFVSDDEKKMNSLGREIVTLTNENIELQNKLDNLHSFNKVEDFIKNKSTLNTAKNIIEIPSVNVINETPIEPVSVSYKWSLGY